MQKLKLKDYLQTMCHNKIFDIEVIVEEAHQLGYYSNLITSGVGLTDKRIDAFKRR